MKLALMQRRERETATPGCPGSRVSYDEQKATLNLLGMTLTEVVLDEERSRKLGSRTGVVVLVVDATRDAHLGGVRNGDLVAEVNSVKITRLQDLKRVLQEHDPHDPIFMFLLGGTGWRFVNLSFIGSLP
ncbi:PDZ domain-containing protein [Geomonas oryzae]|uniref:PDZ domain-containing protein n=1 Tax=Geomonas oryzae TaxID=2364273 RepID=UPI00100ACCEE|nr:PDZ domain-containing protein [Geomonas oryzae]